MYGLRTQVTQDYRQKEINLDGMNGNCLYEKDFERKEGSLLEMAQQDEFRVPQPHRCGKE